MKTKAVKKFNELGKVVSSKELKQKIKKNLSARGKKL